MRLGRGLAEAMALKARPPRAHAEVAEEAAELRQLLEFEGYKVRASRKGLVVMRDGEAVLEVPAGIEGLREAVARLRAYGVRVRS